MAPRLRSMVHQQLGEVVHQYSANWKPPHTQRMLDRKCQLDPCRAAPYHGYGGRPTRRGGALQVDQERLPALDEAPDRFRRDDRCLDDDIRHERHRTAVERQHVVAESRTLSELRLMTCQVEARDFAL